MDIANIYNQIGYAGIVLIICAIAAVFIGFRTLIYLNIVWRGFKQNFLNKEYKNRRDIVSACNNTHNPLIAIIRDIVNIHGEHSEDIRSEVAYLFHRNFEHVSKSLVWLRLISIISPLLGLLGTVLGMVGVFKVIAVEQSPDAASLAGGIWEAMLTTVMGLIVAIPVLIIYYYLMLKFRAFNFEAIEHSYRALDICKKQNNINEQQAAL